jgi:hypothetical protein
MFKGAAAFQQDLCGWNLAHIIGTVITDECTDGALCGNSTDR